MSIHLTFIKEVSNMADELQYDENDDTKPRSLNETSAFLYQLDSDGPQLLLGYLDCTVHTNHDLKIILNKAESFEQLKQELTVFIDNREKFFDDMYSVWDDDVGFKIPEPQ